MEKRAVVHWLICMLFAGCSPFSQITAETDIPPLSDATNTQSPGSTRIPAALQATTTPGPTFTPIPSLPLGRSVAITRLYMFDVNTGWGIEASGHIVRTADGGGTWNDVTPQQGTYEEGGFFPLDAQTAWATPFQHGCNTVNCSPPPDFATIWRTMDGGNTWQAQPLCIGGGSCGYEYAVDPEYYDPVGMQFLDHEMGWLLVSVKQLNFQDSYRLYQTTDGGSSWVMASDSLTGPAIFSATGIGFLDPYTGWITEDNVGGEFDPVPSWVIHKTQDGGNTWEPFQLPEPANLPAIVRENLNGCGVIRFEVILPQTLDMISRCLILEGDLKNYSFYHHHSPDAGLTWTSWPRSGEVDFVGPFVGWRFVASTSDETAQLQKTTDGGRTWMAIKAVLWEGARLDFFTEERGWAIAFNGDTTALLRTTDGGQSWQDLIPVTVP
jgi:photosystem II stability/assembly factor-like uncharacterized protein